MGRKISLNGVWAYEPQAHIVLKPGSVFAENTDNLPPAGQMTLPTCWQLGGLDNFHGRVHFRRTFTWDGLQSGEAQARLFFRGVDYFAHVWLNGQEIGQHAGHFQPFDFDITSALRHGVNELIVDVTCPLEEPGTVWPDNKILIKGVISHWDCRPGSWDHRTGQDKNSGGIWHDVYLETFAAARINHIRVTTRLVPGEVPSRFDFDRHIDVSKMSKQAMVLVDSEILGPEADYTLRVKIGDAPEVVEKISTRGQPPYHTVVVTIPKPRLWWTWDLGEPHLETVTVRLEQNSTLLHERQIETGLREIKLDDERGEWWLNGVRFFVRGTNVVPTLWLSEYDAAMIGKDIDLLRAAHVNGVRVCVHVNRDEFYTACDKAGILVWQDFALQWGYASTQDLYREAVRQIKDMVRLLVNHPCIALWCCQNESTFHNKFVLDPVLADAVSTEDGSRYIRPTSEFTEHTYMGWYWGDYHEYASIPATPVLTEFGAQALPDEASVREMFGDVWPPDWDKMAYHDFQYDQTFHVAGVQMGNNWSEFVQNSQNYQARLLKYALERYRQAKYEKLGGLFHFLFGECWPSITWAVVGYNRVPKKGYYTLQQCFQPVLIGMPVGRERVFLGADRGSHPRPLIISPWVVNDRHEALNGLSYTARISGPGGEFQFDGPGVFDVPADGVLKHAPQIVASLPIDLKVGHYTVGLTLKCGDETLSQNEYEIEIVDIP